MRKIVVLLTRLWMFAGTFLLLTIPPNLHAAVFNVPAGDVAALINAITIANANGEANTINLTGSYGLTALNNTGVTGPNGLPVIIGNITIKGAGAAAATLIRRNVGTPVFRIFEVHQEGVLTIERLTIAGGATLAGGAGAGIANAGTLTLRDSIVRDNSADAQGGGIFNGTGLPGGSTLIITNSTIRGNSAGSGGGIFNYRGIVTLVNSTISGNSASNGGAITNESDSSSTVSLNNVTVADNNAVGGGGGINNAGAGTVRLGNTILARNVNAGGSGHDCSGSLTSRGYNLIQNTSGCIIDGDISGNLIGLDPNMGPLQANRGLTQTHALLVGSPAIDGGSQATPGSGGTACEVTDQRGVARPQGAACDIGAYEATTTTDIAFTLYGYNSVTDELIRIDPTTAGTTPIGRVGFAPDIVVGLAYDPMTDTLYGALHSEDPSVASRSLLIKIDRTTGRGTLVTPMQFPLVAGFGVDDLTMGPGDILYGLVATASSRSYLMTLDPVSGVAIRVDGSTSGIGELPQSSGLAFEPESGRMFASRIFSTNSLYEIDLATGGLAISFGGLGTGLHDLTYEPGTGNLFAVRGNSLEVLEFSGGTIAAIRTVGQIFSANITAIASVETVAAPPAPVLSVLPPSLDFGPVTVGSIKDLSFTVTNAGGGTLTGSCTTATPFSLPDGCAFSLGAGQSQPITVRFSPTSSDTFLSNVTFTSNGGDVSPIVQGQSVLAPVPPSIIGIDPISGPTSTWVTIVGMNFGTNQGGSTVEFGSIAANIYGWSDSQVVAAVPSLAPGSYNLTVTTSAGTSNPMVFTVTSSGAAERCQRLLFRPRSCELVAQLRDKVYFNVPQSDVSDERLLQYIGRNEDAVRALLLQIDYGRDLDGFLKGQTNRLDDERRFIRSLNRVEDLLGKLKLIADVLSLLNESLAFAALSASIEALSPIIEGLTMFQRLQGTFTAFSTRAILQDYFDGRRSGQSVETAWDDMLNVYGDQLLQISARRRVSIDRLGEWFEDAFVAYQLVGYPDSEDIRFAEGRAIARIAAQGR